MSIIVSVNKVVHTYIHTNKHIYNIYITPYYKISRHITNGLTLHLTLLSYITEYKAGNNETAMLNNGKKSVI